jgi:heme-degrading monooxygenase HmoA
MIAVIFEVQPKPAHAHTYFDIAADLKAELELIDGFISVERFESLTEKGKFLSLSFFKTEEAVAKWRTHAQHRDAQKRGKDELFAGYRIRVAQTVRDYGHGVLASTSSS